MSLPGMHGRPVVDVLRFRIRAREDQVVHEIHPARLCRQLHRRHPPSVPFTHIGAGIQSASQIARAGLGPELRLHPLNAIYNPHNQISLLKSVGASLMPTWYLSQSKAALSFPPDRLGDVGREQSLRLKKSVDTLVRD